MQTYPVRLSKSSISVFITAFLLLCAVAFSVYADGPVMPGQAPAGAAAPVAGQPLASGPQQSPFGMMMPLLIMFAVVYFLMIRPQQKKAKNQQQMITALTHGDEVVTSSGFLGKITGIADKVVTLELADNCKVKVLKSQIAQVIKGQIKDLA